MRSKLVILGILLAVGTAFGQFKPKTESSPSADGSLVRSDDSGLMFGWFDPSRLTMRNSVSMSYTSFAGKGISLGTFTNSLQYQFSEAWSLQTDISLVNSPFNSFGDKFSKDISGLYLSRAALTYRPSDNTLFQVQFQQLPAASLYSGFGWGGFLGSSLRPEGTH